MITAAARQAVAVAPILSHSPIHAGRRVTHPDLLQALHERRYFCEPTQKMCRVSASQGLCEMADALSQMADVMKSRLASKARPESPKTSTADPLTVAVTVPQRDEGLSEDERVEAACYFLTVQRRTLR